MSRTVMRPRQRRQTKADREAILHALGQVLASPHFSKSERYPALLEYVVDRTLAGKSGELKERTIGVEVFKRPLEYDTTTDTVVRYTAGEVRKRLSLYYHELPQKPEVQISLPVGSYVPEFLHPLGEREDAGTEIVPAPASAIEVHAAADEQEAMPVAEPMALPGTHSRRWIAAAAIAVAAILGTAFAFRSRVLAPQSALDSFWAPLLKDRHPVLLCSGGVIFNPGTFSGVVTAGKDADYPFISGQMANSIVRISGLAAGHGVPVDLQFSATTPLTTLRNQPLVLLGGYNNVWTMRLMERLPIHFAPQYESIVDASDPKARWGRDETQPYATADDYALLARFRDPTTDSWVIALAGVGRNGTEAAAQFATDPRYMQLLRDAAGKDIANRNVEAVLKISVIEGKTGAPTIQTVRVW